MLRLKLFLSIILICACGYSFSVYADAKLINKIQYKPHAPVDMMFNIDTTKNESIKTNQQVSMQVTFKNNIDVDDLIIHLHTNNELTLISSNEYYFGLQSSFQKNMINIVVVPKVEGVLYINISATLVSNGIRQSRSFAIPVNVGNYRGQNAFKASANSNEMKAVDGVISMPAVKK